MDYIRIDGLEVECIVGVRPRERRRKQPVRLDISLGLDVSQAAKSGRIGHTVDYSRVADQIALLLRFREYRLIEMATEELCAMLFGLYPMLDRVAIRLEKPAALHGRARGASVEIERDKRLFAPTIVTESWGHREVLLETQEAELDLFHVHAGGRLGPDREPLRRRVEWLAEGRIERAGTALLPFTPVLWPRGRLDEYVNSGSESATLFSCVCGAVAE